MVEEIRNIRPAKSVNAEIQLPPSKSYTNRALIAAALAEGISIIHHPSRSDDSILLVEALRKFGITIHDLGDKLEIHGTNGNLEVPTKEVFVGNAGTVMRFLASFACLAEGETILTGDEQMNKRPINDLVETLKTNGIKCSCQNGFPPVKILGGNFAGGRINVDASISSQFVSSILLASPYTKRPLTVHVNGKLSSMPYVDMTLHVMRSFGAIINSIDMKTFSVDNRQRYIGHDFTIEPDASSATYFLGAAAITKGRVIITNLSSESLQGDIQFLSILSEMGCTVIKHPENIEIHGANLHGIEVDMNEIPDCVPTLAVVAAFAKGTTTIKNIAHVRHKETDRLNALSKELTKIGAKVELSEDELVIHPQPLHGAVIETYNDHRIAMSFAVAGLRVDGIKIINPMCVTKSFPNFWEEFKKLEG
ncbi:MAG: 3-phosphoshikimate 1-carboxyvinyltransferase [Ignavibacteriales bacterium]|nr:3-phosphoshikimate 1-carboxyvinyltransferase [Ignavibacteriales bacterium]